jgi:hypothetical protein
LPYLSARLALELVLIALLFASIVIIVVKYGFDHRGVDEPPHR